MSRESAPLAIVADVHGESGALASALAHYRKRRHVILVGDYVNRGPNSAEVLEIVAQAVLQGDATALLGNHDYAFLEYLRSGELAPFARLGGLATINSYVGAVDEPREALLARIPKHHLALLHGLQVFYEDDQVLVSHCGVPPCSPESRSAEDLVLGSHSKLFEPSSGSFAKTVICGHYIQREGVPFVSDRFICIDTGCGTIPGRPLAVLELPEREIRYFEHNDR